MGAYLLPLLVESGVTAYGLTAAFETGKDMKRGKQSVDPRGWTAEQWTNMVAGGVAGVSSTVMALQRGSVATITRVIGTGYAARLALPLYSAYVVHDTVMDPGSHYYIAPDTPLLPGAGGIQLFGGDVSSKLLTAAAQDLAAFMS